MATIDRYKNYNSTKGINFLPIIPEYADDEIIIIRDMDRLDLIANRKYNDSSLWWVIAKANKLPGDSIYVETGTELRIPKFYRIEKIFK